jgi:uncharacterized protein YjbI with pentapeptide repeats
MANKDQLKMLKQSVKSWNMWREDHPDHKPYLSEADLGQVDLTAANLEEAWLDRANLRGAILTEANLGRADLRGAKLIRANLSRANLGGADLSEVDLSEANLKKAGLVRANLREANLSKAILTEADFTECLMFKTVVADVDLSSGSGLETISHHGPSRIDIETIYKSGGKVPEVFLRGCGVPENFIQYMNSLAGPAFEFYSCFISYSSKDQEFATRLHADLQSNGVRCWFAPEDLKIGAKLRPAFDEAIRLHDKLIVILSESSVRSQWVEEEVETAFEKERKQETIVLFPIRLDDVVMETDQPWAADIRQTRHIGDFRTWKNRDFYKKAFDRLLRDLKAEAKAEAAVQR